MDARRKENIDAIRQLLVSCPDANVIFWANFICSLGGLNPMIHNRDQAIKLFAGWRDSAQRELRARS